MQEDPTIVPIRQPTPPTRRGPARLAAAALALALALPGAAGAQSRGVGDHVDVTAVAVEGSTAEQCRARTDDIAREARALSLATAPPYDMTAGIRTFYDHTLRLDANGELQSTAQLSTVYVAGHTRAGAPILRAVTPFVRVEVARPPGTPADAPSRISFAWLWLQRLAEFIDPGSRRTIQSPSLQRFDVAGELATTYGTWGHAVAPCRAGPDGLWFGAVVVWTYLPP